MPYWFDTAKLKIGKKRDRRRKLTDWDKRKIKFLYHFLFYPIRKIARIYKKKCSRRNIQYILFRDRYLKQVEYARQRNWNYDREYHTKAMKRHRQYKKEIYGLRKEQK